MEGKLWEPSVEQAIALRSFSRNGEHYARNANQIREKYAGKFIAIHNEEVILSAVKANDLLTQLRGRFPEPALFGVFVTYIPTEQEVRIA